MRKTSPDTRSYPETRITIAKARSRLSRGTCALDRLTTGRSRQHSLAARLLVLLQAASLWSADAIWSPED